MAVGISSKLGVIFPAPRMDLRISGAVIGGKSTWRLAIVRALKGISPASAELVRRFYTRISRLLEILLIRPVLRFYGSWKGGLLYVPII